MRLSFTPPLEYELAYESISCSFPLPLSPVLILLDISRVLRFGLKGGCFAIQFAVVLAAEF